MSEPNVERLRQKGNLTMRNSAYPDVSERTVGGTNLAEFNAGRKWWLRYEALLWYLRDGR